MKQCLQILMLFAVLGLSVAVLAQADTTPAASPSQPAELTQDLPADDTPPSDTPEITTGNAGATATLLQKLRAGGTTVVVQVLFSIVGLAVAIERFINLRRTRIAPASLFRQVDALWSQGKLDEVRALCDRHPSTLSRMVRALIEHRHGAATDAATVAGDIGTRELKLHLQKAYPIAVVATIEPLLGLFGTVWGMILAFDKIALLGSMGNAAALSSEISLALVTTAVGLAIAIPMLLLYHYFKGRTSLLGITLEEQANELISRHLVRKSPEVDNAH